VSGVSSLFTREFYRRVRAHLRPGGLLAQWFQLYEIDVPLVASVMRALGEEFPHYAVYALSDHDLLIVAGDAPPPGPHASVFEQPGLAKELWTVHVLSIGDLDARYLGDRRVLEPLFASYGMPANSDYYPVLDLNAAKHRFMERSAAGIVGLLNLGVPVLELLDSGRGLRPVNPLHPGAYAFTRVENVRLARYARDFLLQPRPPTPEAVPTQLQKDLEITRTRLIDCRAPRELDVWLHSALRVAKAINPYLLPGEAAAVWSRMTDAACFGELHEFQRRWVALHRAAGARDGAAMGELASLLLDTQQELSSEAREYLVTAAMAGWIGSGSAVRAREVWRSQIASLPQAAGTPALRLLRCHAEPGGAAACAQLFAPFAAR
jgi:hypothetical protein